MGCDNIITFGTQIYFPFSSRHLTSSLLEHTGTVSVVVLDDVTISVVVLDDVTVSVVVLGDVTVSVVVLGDVDGDVLTWQSYGGYEFAMLLPFEHIHVLPSSLRNEFPGHAHLYVSIPGEARHM